MAHQENVLSVFVASPSDVGAERGILEDVIRELNVSWSRELSIRLELVRWETHAYPGIGVDAQDVINQTIPDDYDIFIGIMWCRYGTATQRAGSGTVEEFEIAKSKFDNDPTSTQIMIYFKDEPIPPSKLDPEQIIKINSFKQGLGKEGVLYWGFDNQSHFEKLVRLHLTRQVQTWKTKSTSASNSSLATSDKITTSTQNDDDEGILDLMDKFEEKFEKLTEISERIGHATGELGKKLSSSASELTKLNEISGGKAPRKDAKKIITKASSDMNYYTNRMEAELPLFSESMNIGMNAFIEATTLSSELATSEDNQLNANQSLDELRSLKSALSGAKDSMMGFRQNVDELPRMTTDLNKAKRGTVAILDDFLSEITNGQALISEAEKVIISFLNQPI